MALFQASVLKSHLTLLDEIVVEKAYKKYQKYFWNTTIQENIKSAKEEQYQATFLNELFVNILGYTLFPNPNSNLTTEFKNEKNSRKADAAVLRDGTAIGVIELKGTNTKDLESIRRQAFDYKANQKGCVYVITSNFEKLRIYINDATEFEEFDLFTLTRKRFDLLYLCLHIDKVFNNTPLKIKEASIAEEEEITKAFYKDYSNFKRELYRDLVRKNSKTVKEKLNLTANIDDQEDIIRLEKNIKLTLFQKSQKLIDRFLFIFFAEDRMLLPSNSTLQILNKWKDDWDFGDERPLHGLFKQYFNYLDTGRQGTEKRAEIYAYNGGLFRPDSILDALEIDNDLLYKYALKLSNYDFESQVDVNILGHIFENSLNEIESVNAEIEGGDFDKQTSKRKKDGVFYTPKYITKYIVENTVGKLCSEKKQELGFDEEQYFKGRKNRNKTTIENLVTILEEYREWLLQLTICDPACGSGAFLNQALGFLIKEHTYIDELKTKILGGGFQFPDIENTILENNIYGVDLNEESVEIAKLSLWLRTAQPRRKLNDLSSNVKCGNSLIDDKKVAGDKAFKWENEFPDVFKKGGFDVIFGNPPYVRQELITEIKPFLEKRYAVYMSSQDLFAYFYEKAFSILKADGIFGFISNTFDKTKAAYNLRDYLTKTVVIEKYIDFTQVQIFDGATTYPIIITARNSKPNKEPSFDFSLIPKKLSGKVIDIESLSEIKVKQNSLDSESWSFNSQGLFDLIKGIKTNFPTINENSEKSYRGIVTGFNDAFIIDSKTRQQLIEKHLSSTEVIKPFLEGRDLSKWHSPDAEKFLIFTRRGIDIEKYPAVKEYLSQFKERLTPRNAPDIKVGRKKGSYKWYEIQDSVDYFKKFETSKIVWPNLQSSNKFSLDSENYYINAPSVILPNASKAILCILNSKLVWEFLKSICVVRSGGYIEVKPQYFEQIPIPEFQNEEFFRDATDRIIGYVNDLQNLENRFQSYFKGTLQLNRLQRKLESWYNLDFASFIKELNKAIKSTNKVRVVEDLSVIPTLSKKDEFEWMDLFEENKKKAQELQSQIASTENEIDQMVYKLYGLSDEEIEIVENS
ncbi:Eco57I restriction-modification methylase domain-containing protein [Gillisia hiemivivida]|uniref:site-specific DNA-methyltransferase (adenine-specific) n=1 Tax=Gillisia hiemivivida TaxID=291190 RepID=A0A5C6ZQP4_9FLAO|nr:DNA methyltransferase [Gillisia hiemivivida]TXD92657.1 N-6 DNA methylase [Gillisia hiemivivida]